MSDLDDNVEALSYRCKLGLTVGRDTLYVSYFLYPITCGDAPNCTLADLSIPPLAGVNCAKHWDEPI